MTTDSVSREVVYLVHQKGVICDLVDGVPVLLGGKPRGLYAVIRGFHEGVEVVAEEVAAPELPWRIASIVLDLTDDGLSVRMFQIMADGTVRENVGRKFQIQPPSNEEN
jgi:hypothetical protein